jgi:hypothetical protein
MPSKTRPDMATQWKRVAIPPAAINPLTRLKGTFFILADTPIQLTLLEISAQNTRG